VFYKLLRLEIFWVDFSAYKIVALDQETENLVVLLSVAAYTPGKPVLYIFWWVGMFSGHFRFSSKAEYIYTA